MAIAGADVSLATSCGSIADRSSGVAPAGVPTTTAPHASASAVARRKPSSSRVGSTTSVARRYHATAASSLTTPRNSTDFVSPSVCVSVTSSASIGPVPASFSWASGYAWTMAAMASHQLVDSGTRRKPAGGEQDGRVRLDITWHPIIDVKARAIDAARQDGGARAGAWIRDSANFWRMELTQHHGSRGARGDEPFCALQGGDSERLNTLGRVGRSPAVPGAAHATLAHMKRQQEPLSADREGESGEQRGRGAQ